MKISAKGLALIKEAEGLELEAYRCSAGVLTIGYGHTGDDVDEGEKITKAEAESLLKRDLARFEKAVAEHCPEATSGQFSAMVCLAFNIGTAAFKKSSVARLHNAARYADAAQAFALWNKGGGKVLPGLVKRRAKEAALYLSDVPDADEVTASIAEGEGKSRVMTGNITAGTAIAASTALPTIKEALVGVGDFRDTVVELLPYLDQLKWVLLILGFLGIAYSLYARWQDRRSGRA